MTPNKKPLAEKLNDIFDNLGSHPIEKEFIGFGVNKVVRETLKDIEGDIIKKGDLIIQNIKGEHIPSIEIKIDDLRQIIKELGGFE